MPVNLLSFRTDPVVDCATFIPTVKHIPEWNCCLGPIDRQCNIVELLYRFSITELTGGSSVTTNTWEIEQLLRDVLPMEAELSGDEHLRNAARMVEQGILLPTDYSDMPGHKLEPVSALAAIAAAANFVKTCIDVYLQLRKQSRAPTKEEFGSEVAKQTASMTETTTRLAAAVFALLTKK